jgi:hypothetical protein
MARASDPDGIERMMKSAEALVHEQAVTSESLPGSRGTGLGSTHTFEEALSEGEHEAAWMCLKAIGVRVHASSVFWQALAEIATALGDQQGRSEALEHLRRSR